MAMSYCNNSDNNSDDNNNNTVAYQVPGARYTVPDMLLYLVYIQHTGDTTLKIIEH